MLLLCDATICLALKKNEETGLGSEKKRKKSVSKSKKNVCMGQTKKWTSRQIFYMRHFFTLQKNV